MTFFGLRHAPIAMPTPSTGARRHFPEFDKRPLAAASWRQPALGEIAGDEGSFV
jgi:hypothetical protein